MKTKVFAFACALLLGGCAAVPKGVGKGEAVAFMQEPAAKDAPAVELSNAAIGQSAKTGTGTGMLVGAAAGLSCGPLAIFCSPVGAVIGGLGGAVLGAGVGVAQALPADVQAQLQRRIDTFVAGHDVRGGLMTAIADRGKGHWVPVSAGPSASVVRVKIETVALYSDQAGRVGLAIRVAVTTRPPGGELLDDAARTFEYIGVSSDPRLWIDDSDEFMLTSFRQGYAHVAQDVFAYLAR